MVDWPRLFGTWGWLLGTILSVAFTGIIAYLARGQLSGRPSEIYFCVVGVAWLLAFAIWMLRVEDPIRIMTTTEGRRCSILEDVQKAREWFMGQILTKAKELPVLNEEDLDAITKLVQSAGEAKGLMDGLGRARELRVRFAAVLVVALPIAVLIGLGVSQIPDGLNNNLAVLSFTSLAIYFLWMFAGGDWTFETSRWASRVTRLSGATHNIIRDQIRAWAQEKKA
jgi:hypothetical protein